MDSSARLRASMLAVLAVASVASLLLVVVPMHWLEPLPPPALGAVASASSGATFVAGTASSTPGEVSNRLLATRVHGRVLDPVGRPVAGASVALTGTERQTVTDADGRFAFASARTCACQLVPSQDWLAIESPLLPCGAGGDGALQLFAAPGSRLQGRIIDDTGAGVAGAAVAVELELPAAQNGAVQSVRLRSWSTATDADGWYLLPFAPIGGGAELVITRPGFVRHACALGPDFVPYSHTNLVRLPAQQPANSSVAKPPQVQELAGRLQLPRCAHGETRWVAARPVATPGDGYACLPVQVQANGSFTLATPAAAGYHLEVWGDRSGQVFRSQVVTSPDTALQLSPTAVELPTRLHGQLLDIDGAPIANARIGLARPTAWATQGWAAMHPLAQTQTDAGGLFAFESQGLAALELCVDGAACVPTRVPLCCGDREDQPLSLRATPRRWLSTTREASPGALADAHLVVLDAQRRRVPIWLHASPIARRSCPVLDAHTIGVPPTARTVVVLRGSTELAWLRLGQ